MKWSVEFRQKAISMPESDAAANNGEATSPKTRQPLPATFFIQAVKLHMKQWYLGPLQPLLVIVRVTTIFLLALLAETLILMAIHWSFGNSIPHTLFAAKLLEGLQLLSALGTALAYLLYLMRSLLKEAKQVEERQPQDNWVWYTMLKRYFMKTLQGALPPWVTLAVGMAVTSLLYATLTTAGLAKSSSLLVAFSTLVGFILLSLLVATKASSLNLLQATRTWLRKATRAPEAEPLLQRALAIYEKQLEAGHPDTAQSLNNLALLYAREGRYEQAEPLYQHALTIYEKRLGAEHPDTAQSLNNLALLYAREGRYEQAEPLLQRALAIDEKLLGAEHRNTRAVQANYARLLQKLTDEQAQQPTPYEPQK